MTVHPAPWVHAAFQFLLANEPNTLEPPGIHFAGEPLIHFSPGADARIGPPEAVVLRESPEGGACRRLPAW